ncbi:MULTISPECIES: LysR family substrate-binding domain-containing protein [unclassified Streptomyces]|uniref:LysR family substrate-binding domain-containing protein n=1 Tax=unclassified Streptomyces TaxID=2593676 RepID=UPI0018F77B72|nr:MULTISPECIES: LysR family substrate-binding domain-containing protein [unclassified Streptomyces]
MTGPEATPSFRLAYVPGVTPTKWVRIWNERLPGIPLTLVQVTAAEAQDLLRAGEADAGFLRLPVAGTDLSAIPLYAETTVVVVPKDHVIAAVDELSVAELADEIVLHPLDDSLVWERLPGRPAVERPATTADAVELVAAGIGVLVVPQSLARLHHRKDLTYRPLTDAPESRVALSWPQEKTTDQVEDFIGIVRGRTVNSSRGRAGAPPAQPKAKAKDKQKPSSGTAAGKGGRGGSGSGRSGGAKGTRGAKGGAAPKRGKPRRRP